MPACAWIATGAFAVTAIALAGLASAKRQSRVLRKLLQVKNSTTANHSQRS